MDQEDAPAPEVAGGLVPQHRHRYRRHDRPGRDRLDYRHERTARNPVSRGCAGNHGATFLMVRGTTGSLAIRSVSQDQGGTVERNGILRNKATAFSGTLWP